MTLKPQFLGILLLTLSLAANVLASDVVMHPKNEQPIDADQIKSMLIGKQRFWDNGTEVIIAILKDDAAAEEALKRYCGMTSSKFKNHWQRISFSGRGKMPKTFPTLPELISYVNEHPGAIAVAPAPKTIAHLGGKR